MQGQQWKSTEGSTWSHSALDMEPTTSANFLSEFLIRSAQSFCRWQQNGTGCILSGIGEGQGKRKRGTLFNLKSPVSCALCNLRKSLFICAKDNNKICAADSRTQSSSTLHTDIGQLRLAAITRQRQSQRQRRGKRRWVYLNLPKTFHK